MKSSVALYTQKLAGQLRHGFDLAVVLHEQDPADIFDRHGYDVRAPYQVTFMLDEIDLFPDALALNTTFFVGRTHHEKELYRTLDRNLNLADDALTVLFDVPTLVPMVTTPDDMRKNRYVLTHQRRHHIVIDKNHRDITDILDYTVDCLRAIHDNAHDLTHDLCVLRSSGAVASAYPPY